MEIDDIGNRVVREKLGMHNLNDRYKQKGDDFRMET
jgi:hypothetical protein